MEGRKIKQILLVNTKGGCGKTTIATNLSSYYASRHIPTALVDHDPQASSIQWLESRHPSLNPITGVAAYKHVQSGMTKSWAMRIPIDVERIIIDTPAGLPKEQLIKQARQSDFIIIPVLPSPIDIRALGGFIKELYFTSNIRQQAKLAVVANRVRKDTLVFNALESFLQKIDIPFITTLRDTQNYIKVAEKGMGIHEISLPGCQKDHEQWSPLINWIEEKQEYDNSK